MLGSLFSQEFGNSKLYLKYMSLNFLYLKLKLELTQADKTRKSSKPNPVDRKSHVEP